MNHGDNLIISASHINPKPFVCRNNTFNLVLVTFGFIAFTMFWLARLNIFKIKLFWAYYYYYYCCCCCCIGECSDMHMQQWMCGSQGTGWESCVFPSTVGTGSGIQSLGLEQQIHLPTELSPRNPPPFCH